MNKTRAATATAPIGIIGASYAGLALANVLHRHSIPFTILDSKALPFTHVVGGAKFEVPSYRFTAKKLGLKVPAQYKSDGPTRKDVIDALLERVNANLITSQRIVRIEQKSGLFYLHSRQQRDDPKNEPATRIIGPFLSVIGADGVLSKVRVCALQGTFLVGDARWASDRWYDLGLRRIDRGADIALRDGLELGDAMVRKELSRARSRVKSKFCACEIAKRRAIRMFATAATTAAALLFGFRGELGLHFQNPIYTLKDAVFGDDCLDHDRSNPLTFQFHERLQTIGLGGTYSLLPPNLLFWIQTTVLLATQSVVSVLLAISIYYGIIRRRGSTFARILRWG